jgi:hypothetical protein
MKVAARRLSASVVYLGRPSFPDQARLEDEYPPGGGLVQAPPRRSIDLSKQSNFLCILGVILRVFELVLF